MKHRALHELLLTASLLMLHGPAGALEPPELAHNPFSRPPSEATFEDRPVVRADGKTQDLELRATMVAPNSRLANVAGRTLRPGDEVAGFTLLQVFEDRAVFTKGGSRLTVYVKPDLEEDDD